MSIQITLQDIEEYICNLCFEFSNIPYELCDCKHTFCSFCINKLKVESNKKVCPVCLEDSLPVKKIIDKIVNCRKCEIKIPLSELKIHLKERCDKNFISCYLCDELYPYYYNHLQFCKKAFIKCKDCEAIIKRDEIDAHSSYYCLTPITTICKICNETVSIINFGKHYSHKHLALNTSVNRRKPEIIFNYEQKNL